MLSGRSMFYKVVVSCNPMWNEPNIWHNIEIKLILSFTGKVLEKHDSTIMQTNTHTRRNEGKPSWKLNVLSSPLPNYVCVYFACWCLFAGGKRQEWHHRRLLLHALSSTQVHKDDVSRKKAHLVIYAAVSYEIDLKVWAVMSLWCHQSYRYVFL